ncbi:MAG TPA: BON domain-containing protein [Pelomicrobium sp.]|nr:BON domain-containing protein [Pelomicrobium sp.]
MKLRAEHPFSGTRIALVAAAAALMLGACGQEQGSGTSALPAANEYSVAPPTESRPQPATSAPPAAAPAPNAPPPDGNTALAGKVKDAVKAAIGGGAYKVDVTARDGSVTLWGTTDTDEDRIKAEQAARAAAGGATVINELVVVKGS